MRLTLVIPVYKEHLRLAESLKKVAAFVDASEHAVADAIFVDDGSPDPCSEVIRDFISKGGTPRLQLIRYPVNRGKGYAVKTGVLAAQGDLVLMSDADLSTPLEDWLRLKAAVDAGADMACGSRAVRGAHIGRPPPLHRRVLSRIFNLLVRAAGVRGIRDTQCGFKLFRAGPAKEVFGRLRTRRFAFDVEMIALARDLGYRVEEVPVDWDYSGHSTVKVFSSGGRMLFDLFLLAARRLVFGKCRR
ncbi:MAG: glycosyltransferase family 2 protein [Kiritimatiellae bacterium]|nr:glycosyltransferase family 2 protein [Kiritimatiellia bacterium]